MTLSDTVRIANQFADREERALAGLEPFTAFGIRWQVVDGEPSPIGAEWTDQWFELVSDATVEDFAFASIVYRTLGARRREPENYEAVDPELAAAVCSFWHDHLVEQMERAA